MIIISLNNINIDSYGILKENWKKWDGKYRYHHHHACNDSDNPRQELLTSRPCPRLRAYPKKQYKSNITTATATATATTARGVIIKVIVIPLLPPQQVGLFRGKIPHHCRHHHRHHRHLLLQQQQQLLLLIQQQLLMLLLRIGVNFLLNQCSRSARRSCRTR